VITMRCVASPGRATKPSRRACHNLGDLIGRSPPLGPRPVTCAYCPVEAKPPGARPGTTSNRQPRDRSPVSVMDTSRLPWRVFTNVPPTSGAYRSAGTRGAPVGQPLVPRAGR
jgi:hypothetical protein